MPNPAARSLVTRRTDSIAVVVPEPDDRVFSDPFFAGTLRGVNRVLAERDIQLVLLLARPGASTARTLRYLTNRHVDGALVTSHHRDDRLAEHLADIGLPCVFGGRPWTGGDRVAYVDVDNTAGEREATEVLIARGCTRIGTIAGPARHDRRRRPPRGLAQGDGDGRPARRRGRARRLHRGQRRDRGRARLMERHPDLDGLVVASDLMAVGALRVLAELGRRVPDDIAVVGFDDLGVSERTTPPLTTVRQPVEEMAERATRLLLERVDAVDGAHPMRLIIPPTVVRRASA